jgi:hypothetical protein
MKKIMKNFQISKSNFFQHSIMKNMNDNVNEDSYKHSVEFQKKLISL